MLTVLPKWVIELESKLDKIIKDIAIKHYIDLTMIDDSKSIESGKELISQALVRLYENYDVEGRKILEKIEKDFKDSQNKNKTKGSKK